MTKAERHYVQLYRKQDPTRPINECYWDAKRHIHFKETLRQQVEEHKRRSRAAKKAWKKRRADAKA